MNEILVPILSIVIGLLIAVLAVGYFKSKDSKKKKVTKKVVEKAPMEFSKKIMLVTSIIACVVIAYAMFIIYMMVKGDYMGDPTALNTLIVGLFAEVGVGTSFYFWKSRMENKIKLEAAYGVKVVDDEEEY